MYVNLSIQHTSASLIVQENADPDVQKDLINYFDKLVPMNNKLYVHTTEGKDDMPAHIKSALTNNQISLSIRNAELLLEISNKFNSTTLMYSDKNKDITTQNLVEIINKKDPTYSPLSLYSILDKKLIS